LGRNGRTEAEALQGSSQDAEKKRGGPIGRKRIEFSNGRADILLSKN
jgi:hypothetical protein